MKALHIGQGEPNDKRYIPAGWVGGEENKAALGEKYLEAHGGKYVNGIYEGYGGHTAIFKTVSIAELKTIASSNVNPEAERRIVALDWKKERAEEKPALYSLPDVLNERQAIRDASNQAKDDIEALTTIEEVKAFTW